MEFLNKLTVGEVLQYTLAALAVVSIFVERVKSIPFNPWSSIFAWLGDKMTMDLQDRINSLACEIRQNQDDVNNMTNRILKLEKYTAEIEAERLRSRIIEFTEQCRLGKKHTQKHFENVFRDIDKYNKYCCTYRISNNYIKAEVKYLQNVFDECLRENKFL